MKGRLYGVVPAEVRWDFSFFWPSKIVGWLLCGPDRSLDPAGHLSVKNRFTEIISTHYKAKLFPKKIQILKPLLKEQYFIHWNVVPVIHSLKKNPAFVWIKIAFYSLSRAAKKRERNYTSPPNLKCIKKIVWLLLQWLYYLPTFSFDNIIIIKLILSRGQARESDLLWAYINK